MSITGTGKIFRNFDYFVFRVEKNATPWSKDRLNELLIGQNIEKGSINVALKEFKKIEGDATANNRKAKLIFLFDWVLEIKFEGKGRFCHLDFVFSYCCWL